MERISRIGTWVFLVAAVWAGTAWSGSAQADVLPTHGANVHWDPFGPGAVAAGAGCGTSGQIVPPMTVSAPCPLGADVANAPGQPWHWEIELDFLGLAGVFPVQVNGGPFVPTPFGPGTDIVLDVHQSDLANSFLFGRLCLPGAGETSQQGGVCKQLINLTQIPIAWGTSVTEDGALAPPPPPAMRKGHTVVVSRTANGGIVIRTVPSPASGALLALGLAVAVWTSRRRRRA